MSRSILHQQLPFTLRETNLSALTDIRILVVGYK